MSVFVGKEQLQMFGPGGCLRTDDWEPHATAEDLGPALRVREGDQPLPEVNDTEYIQDLVIADIEERRRLGIHRYGTALQAHNGRDALRDAYEESIDLCMYLRQAIEERDTAAAVEQLARDLS